jgi:hypothetical protein
VLCSLHTVDKRIGSLFLERILVNPESCDTNTCSIAVAIQFPNLKDLNM